MPITIKSVFLLQKESAIVINELMAFNTKSITDPQGQYEDWLELHNVSDTPVNLTGMYLTDKIDNLKKMGISRGHLNPLQMAICLCG